MDRKGFIKNLALACAALHVPKVFQPLKKEIVSKGFPGMIPAILNSPTKNISYAYGDIDFASLQETMMLYQPKSPSYRVFDFASGETREATEEELKNGFKISIQI